MKIAVLLLRRSVQEFFDDNCTQMAAAISYYVLFSLFALLIFLAGILGLPQCANPTIRAEVASEYPRVLRGEHKEGEQQRRAPLLQRLLSQLRSLFISEGRG